MPCATSRACRGRCSCETRGRKRYRLAPLRFRKGGGSVDRAQPPSPRHVAEAFQPRRHHLPVPTGTDNRTPGAGGASARHNHASYVQPKSSTRHKIWGSPALTGSRCGVLSTLSLRRGRIKKPVRRRLQCPAIQRLQDLERPAAQAEYWAIQAQRRARRLPQLAHSPRLHDGQRRLAQGPPRMLAKS